MKSSIIIVGVGGQGDRGEDADDGGHDHQFDQREAAGAGGVFQGGLRVGWCTVSIALSDFAAGVFVTDSMAPRRMPPSRVDERRGLGG